MEQRKLLEKEFHDKIRIVVDDPHVADTRWTSAMEKTIKGNPLWANMKYYSIERKSRNMVLDWFVNNTPAKVVLDYCCGNGADSIFIAENGAKGVYGIDISPVSIDNCIRNAENAGMLDRIEYQVMDAENTAYDDNMFDIVTEYGALHHLDLKKSYAEIVRILKPNGVAICHEALKHNIFIYLYRKMTPHLRTEWEAEHILGRREIELAKEYFGNVEIRFFHLISLVAVPFRNTRLFNPVLSLLEKIDDFILSVPLVRWQAWQIVIILSNPKK